MSAELRCPGCSKHCKASNPKCKYGRKYFEAHPTALSPKLKKWEKRVTPQGPLWQLITTARLVKKSLKDTPEEDILRRLTPQEQDALVALLAKLNA